MGIQQKGGYFRFSHDAASSQVEMRNGVSSFFDIRTMNITSLHATLPRVHLQHTCSSCSPSTALTVNLAALSTLFGLFSPCFFSAVAALAVGVFTFKCRHRSHFSTQHVWWAVKLTYVDPKTDSESYRHAADTDTSSMRAHLQTQGSGTSSLEYDTHHGAQGIPVVREARWEMNSSKR